MSNLKPILKKSKYTMPLACIAIVLLAVTGIVVAATILKNPVDENQSDTPLTPTPTPSPTASPTPSPTPVPSPTEIHLSSNLTKGHYYKTDTLRLTAQLNQPVAGINITLYNFDLPVTSALSDSAGKAVFNRNPQYFFNYSVGFPT